MKEIDRANHFICSLADGYDSVKNLSLNHVVDLLNDHDSTERIKELCAILCGFAVHVGGYEHMDIVYDYVELRFNSPDGDELRSRAMINLLTGLNSSTVESLCNMEKIAELSVSSLHSFMRQLDELGELC